MGKSRPTEEELGIATTEEEIAVSTAPPVDDYPEGGDPDPVVVEAAAEPEPAKVAEPARAEPQKPERPPPGFVDQRALQEARAEKKLLEDRFNTLLEVVNRTTAKPAEPKVEAPAKPVLLEQPIEYIDHSFRDVNERLAKIEGTAAEQEAARAAEEQERQQTEAAVQVAAPQFAEAVAADPTVQPTYTALRINLAREIAWQNSIPFETATPAQQQLLIRELDKLENAHVRYAVGRGENVVDYMMGYAASRGVARAAPQAPQPQPKTIAERQQAQQRHQSLSDAPGSEVPTKLTAKDIAKMSPKQFKALADRIGEAGLDEMMGSAGNA